MPAADDEKLIFLSTGTSGLDDVLAGGLTAERLYLVEWTPGTGKTTLGLAFLLEGAKQGEKTLYVTLAETERELGSVARTHGWSSDNIGITHCSPVHAIRGVSHGF